MSSSSVRYHDSEAEQTVLGAMIEDRASLIDALYALRASDFFDPRHQIIFSTLDAMFVEGMEVTTLLLKDRLRAKGNLGKIGGDTYLLDLRGPVGTSNISVETGIVRRHAHQRELQGLVGSAVDEMTDQALYDAAIKAEDLIAHMRSRSTAAKPRLISEGLEDFLADLEERQRLGQSRGLPTGIEKLDDVLGGFKPGQFIVVGGRPSMGKTGLMVQFAYDAAAAGKRVAFFTLEMSPDEIRARVLSYAGEIPLFRFGAGQLTQDDWKSATNIAAKLSDHVFIVDGRDTLSAQEIALEARRLWGAYKGLDLIVIDYIGLVSADRQENRQEQIAHISRSFKVLARSLEVPVVAGSQLNRELERRENKRPGLADLRESGALEQDSDVVLFLYRDEVYKNTAGLAGKAEIIVAKHRNGKTGSIKARFDKLTATFKAVNA
jgi:replicative DNA helicase